MDIRIIVNKKDVTVPETTTVSRLLESEGYSTRVAVWINGEQLLGSAYDSHILKNEDQVRILRLAAGG